MRGSWGSCGLGPDPGFGPRRVARAAAALEGRDDDHAPAAGRAWRAMVGWRRGDGLGYRVGRRWRRGCGEQLPGAGDVRLARGAGEESVVTDAVEALGQDVEQEAPDELAGYEGHGAVSLLPVATVVLVSERHAVLVEGDQPAVRDGDAVGVAGEIGEHRLRSGEGRLGVDEPVRLPERRELRGEGLWIAQAGEFAEERQPAVRVGGFELLQHQPAKELREHAHRQKEARLARDPFRTIERESAARHDHVDMRMVGHGRAPG